MDEREFMKANKSLENFFLEPKPELAPCHVMRYVFAKTIMNLVFVQTRYNKF